MCEDVCIHLNFIAFSNRDCGYSDEILAGSFSLVLIEGYLTRTNRLGAPPN